MSQPDYARGSVGLAAERISPCDSASGELRESQDQVSALLATLESRLASVLTQMPKDGESPRPYDAGQSKLHEDLLTAGRHSRSHAAVIQGMLERLTC